MMYTRTYLQNLLKEHNLRGYSHYDTKPELMELLIEKGILERPTVKFSTELQLNHKPVRVQPDPRRRNPQCIRPPPKHVKITNVETGEVTEFSSIYKCSKALKINPGSLKWHNNKQMGIYLVEISEYS